MTPPPSCCYLVTYITLVLDNAEVRLHAHMTPQELFFVSIDGASKNEIPIYGGYIIIISQWLLLLNLISLYPYSKVARNPRCEKPPDIGNWAPVLPEFVQENIS